MGKPKIITTRKPLPYDQLSPSEFERLCLWLVDREGYSQVQHLGDAGGDEGRDVIAYKRNSTRETLTYFQCKRYKQISATTLTKEVDKYMALIASDPTKQPDEIIFVTNAVISARIRDKVKKYCVDRSLACDFWARTELDLRVKRHTDIVEEFFDAANAGIVFNGDFYQLVFPHYPALKDYAYNFNDLITSTTRWFVGREYVFALLTQFQTSHPCGYFRITADAGLGKTAMAAEIARRQKAPVFFANESSGLTRPDQCLNHLSALLIGRFRLKHDYFPPRAGDDSSFFSRILAEAVAESNEPIWIVIDGLDEANDSNKGGNPLLLPDHLPQGVYVILTQRPGEYPFATDASTPIVDYVLGWNDSGQQSDIHQHLLRQMERPEIQEALNRAKLRIPIARFVAALQDSSEGNFKYLDYVLADIIARAPGFDPLKAEKLPKGLKGYYAQFWARMENVKNTDGWNEWATLFRKVIALLAVAREPVTLQWLADHTGREVSEIRERVLARWQRFLSHSRKNTSETWRIVHQSFSDFLAEKLDLSLAHGTVASLYLKDSLGGNSHDGYANRHLTHHLRLAGHHDTLFRLIDDRSWYQAQIEADASGATYFDDLNQAWIAAENVNMSFVLDQRPPPLIGRELRCALSIASLHSFSRNLPPALPWLLKSGLWSISTAFGAIQQNPRAEARAEGLAAIAPFLKINELMNALALVRTLGNTTLQARVLKPLLRRLLELGYEVEALDEALKISEKDQEISVLAAQVEVLTNLAPNLSESSLRKGLVAVEKIESIKQTRYNERGELHPGLLSALGEWEIVSIARLAQLGHWSEAVTKIRTIQGEFWRVRAVASIAPFLPSDVREQALNEALQTLREIRALQLKGKALGELAAHLSEDVRERLIREVFQTSGANKFGLGDALRALSPYFDQDLLYEALNKLWKMDEDDAAEAAKGLIPRLAQLGFVGEALGTLWAIKYEPDRAKVLGSLGPYLPEPELREALKLVQAMREEVQANAIAKLLPRLSDFGHAHEALTFARLVADEETRAETIADMAVGVAQFGHPERALEIVRTIELPDCQVDALAWLAHALNESVTREALTLARAAEEKSRDSTTRHSSIADQLSTVEALTELSVRLADLGFPADALESVRIIQDEADRAEALARLVPHLAEPFRSKAQQEALTSLRSTESVRVLNELLPHLPERLLNEATDIICSFHMEQSRADGFRHLVLYLPKSLMWNVLTWSDQLEFDTYKLEVRMGVVERLAVLGEFDESLEVIDITRYGQFQANALALVAKYAPDELLKELLNRANKIKEKEHRAAAVTGLIKYLKLPLLESVKLGPRMKQPLLESLKLERRMEQYGKVLAAVAIRFCELGLPERGYKLSKKIGSWFDRDNALIGVANYLSEPLLREAMNTVTMKADRALFAPRLAQLGFVQEAIQLVASIEDSDRRSPLLAKLAPHFSKLPLVDRYTLWRETLHVLASRTRGDLLYDVRALGQVLAAFGGAEVLIETTNAVRDVGLWWP